MQMVISRRGIRFERVPPGVQLRRLLRAVRVTALAFAAWVVTQTFILFTVDAIL
ncbi:hypothetical protein JQC91_01775 [Jannaschia sp. Os4]|uniref:hypothetical protein n=1 Tax=Jannaschia sp. Os4 TaxID=2807617 RepID=UPI00193AB553|nr:hypothetical protein [Jannaschia sp. Os4]MBM2575021.1 hypothetical protein [Jannaschia sp. Os4]